MNAAPILPPDQTMALDLGLRSIQCPLCGEDLQLQVVIYSRDSAVSALSCYAACHKDFIYAEVCVTSSRIVLKRSYPTLRAKMIDALETGLLRQSYLRRKERGTVNERPGVAE